MSLQPAATPRYQPIYRTRAARGGPGQGRRRHLFRGAGTGITSLCGDAMFTVALADDRLALPCQQCRLVAITELALAVDELGMVDLAVRLAVHARDASYETPGVQVDRDPLHVVPDADPALPCPFCDATETVELVRQDQSISVCAECGAD